VGGLYAIGYCVATGVSLWKLGNNVLGILLEEVYVQVGEWVLLPTSEFPCATCAACVPGVPTIANLSTICAKD
jgi:hypothetical protein